MGNGQNKKSVPGREEVIEHHSKATGYHTLEVSNRRRLHDVEESKDDEGE